MADINQFIDPKLIETIEKLNSLIVQTGQNIDKNVLPSIERLEKSQKDLSKSTNNTAKSKEKLTAAQREASKIEKRLADTEAKLNEQESKRGKALILLQEQQRKQLQLLKAEAKVKAAAKGSNEKLAATISLYEKRLKTVNQTTEKGRAQAERLRQVIDRMNTKLTEQSSQLTRTKRNIGNYGSALSGLGARVRSVAMQFAGALGLTSAVFIFVNVLKGAFSTIRNFTKENAVLAGVLGTTRKEVKQLTDQAISLGAVYPVTASEVTKLQVSFARLGFTQSEIINLTEATIQGSIALNSELDATATLVGAVVKAYSNLGTENAAEIIDKLTLATQRSSLSFESLETALPKVAGAANAVNVSLDETLALLGIAQDATLDASISGTSLRNIFLELSKAGLTLDEALLEINSSSNRLTTAYDLFGKRAAIVALALADNIEKTSDLEVQLNKAGGTAERVAKEQMNTLDGALKSVQSSWEKLVLSIKESEGPLASIARGIANYFDIMSDDFTDTYTKILMLTPGMTAIFGKRIKEQMKIREDYISFVRNADEDELNRFIIQNADKLKAHEEFEKFFYEVVNQRREQLAKQEEDRRKREENAERQAQVEQLAIERELSEKAQEEAEKRAKAWADLTYRKYQLNQESLKNQQEYLDSFSNLIESEEDIFQSNLDKQVEATISASEKIFSEKEKLAEREMELEEEQAERRKELIENEKQVAIQQGIELANFLFDTKIQRLNNELEAAEGNEKKQAELRAKIAQQEKRKALFNIGISTAEGIAKTIANLGLPIAIPFIALTAAIGAVQAAAVSSRPIPEFAKGTDYAPGGLSIVGEKGRELIESPKGEIYLANNPALVNLERGSKVLTNRKTEAYLNDVNIVSELRQTRKAIQKIPQPIFKNGSKISERRGNYWVNYKQSKHRLN